MTIVTTQSELDAALDDPTSVSVHIIDGSTTPLTITTDRADLHLTIGGSARIGQVADSARIDWVRGSARIDSVADSARIGQVAGSARIGQVADSARIDSVAGSARIGQVADSARIDWVAGSARIDSVADSARIDWVAGSARIGQVADSARIDWVADSAQIGQVADSARIDWVAGSARIDWVADSARIGQVADSARIDWVADSAQIGQVGGTAVVHLSGSAHIGQVSGTAVVHLSGSAHIGQVSRPAVVYIHSRDSTAAGGTQIDLTALDLCDIAQWRAYIGADHAVTADQDVLHLPRVSSHDHPLRMGRNGVAQIGCWAGTLSELRKMITGSDWPSGADGYTRDRYRPRILAATDLCEQQLALWAEEATA